MATSTPTSDDRLPSTLFTVYQTYKRGTSVVLEWLTTFDQTPAGKSKTVNQPLASAATAPPAAPSPVTVKQLLEKARKASKNKRVPPPAVHDAFKVVLVNRNKLTKYYDRLPTASTDTIAATTRHKVFNETLAQAYTILFASQISKLGSTRQTTSASHATATSNAFEVLAHVVETEPEFESCASDFWQTEAPIPTTTSSITDDSVGDAIAMHTYVLELQNTVQTIKTIWKSAANGEMPLAAAGFLTNVVHSYLFKWIAAHSPYHDNNDGILYRFFSTEDGRSVAKEGYVHSWLENVDAWRRSSEGEGFQELTHGYGLLWPINEIRRFEALVKAGDDSLTTAERCRFEDYFKTQRDQRVLKSELIDSVLDCVSTSETRTRDEHYQHMHEIIDERYEHDRGLVMSMCRSIYRHPIWNGPMDFSPNADTDWFDYTFKEEYLQFPLGVPLLWGLKACLEPDSVSQTTLVIGAHTFVESCRSFISQHPSDAPHHTNNRIKVLSFARNSRIALQKLLENKSDPVKALHLEPAWADNVRSTIKQLDKFTSEKVFDLYSQSPWVTGSYMATIAARNMMLGLGLISAHGYVSDLLHLYNMLQKLRVPCPQMPLLEHLCDILGPAVFPHMQGRPTNDFDNMARIAKRDPLCSKNRKWMLAGKRLKEKAMGTDDAGMNMVKLSDFASQTLAQQCIVEERLLAKILDERLLAKKHNLMPNMIARFTPSDVLLRAKDHFMPEFDGPCPLAKVNYFAVMDLVLDIWKEVASQLAKPNGVPESVGEFVAIAKARGATGPSSNFHSNTLEAAIGFLGVVRYNIDHFEGKRTDASRWKSLQQNDGLLLLRDAVVKICGDVNLEDFLWMDM
ncbi:uncharacterized protein J4E79_006004 [Alternaria viburni]|uniref:uncharacterized protein n=1 Tax=Alternaria viburni TaxID=566460 RepID=UPI0020C4FA8B|nr:uncharacterized protein J4E79_006004 [Alternaria viburni]KAI4660199.1 hypothetical protein J4E79_006004 [Alternaria viburni]